VEPYEVEGADIVLVAMGSMAGTIRAVVRELRADGRKVGLLKIRSFRPFPHAEVAEALAHARAVGVLDRSISYGSTGALYQEVVRCLYSHASRRWRWTSSSGWGTRCEQLHSPPGAKRQAARRGQVERSAVAGCPAGSAPTWGWES
jgi:pyruvate/2-oxoacid:ferredoxin oxidoreductase alpha subunit